MEFDRLKHLVTVKGTMNCEGLDRRLREKLKKNVEVIIVLEKEDDNDQVVVGTTHHGGTGKGITTGVSGATSPTGTGDDPESPFKMC